MSVETNDHDISIIHESKGVSTDLSITIDHYRNDPRDYLLIKDNLFEYSDWFTSGQRLRNQEQNLDALQGILNFRLILLRDYGSSLSPETLIREKAELQAHALAFKQLREFSLRKSNRNVSPKCILALRKYYSIKPLKIKRL